VSISDPYTALKALLFGNSTLTALLGTFQSTSIPLIEGGILPEVEDDLPAIVFEIDPTKKVNFLGDYNFLLNVYGATLRDATLVALTLIDEFNGCQTVVNGYFTQTTCSILTSVADPSGKEVNVPVVFRLINM
jgi:hypothetical protein